MSIGDFRIGCRRILHESGNRWAKIINSFLVLLIVFSVAAIPFHLIPQLSWTLSALKIFELVTVTIFSIEYVLRLWSAQNPIRYIFSWYGIVDVVAIVPFYTGLFFQTEIAWWSLLFLRVLRVLKLGQIYSTERDILLKDTVIKHGAFETLNNERIEYVIGKHPIFFLLSVVPSLLFLSLGLLILVGFRANPISIGISLLFFVFAFLFFLKSWLDFHYDVIYVTNHRIVIQNRQLFGSKIDDVVYESITNIRPDTTGILRFLLGMGDIHIETAASSGNQYFHNVLNPHEAVNNIARNRQRILEKDNMN
ncbi:ion transporter [Candidatus Peregrinibacteria bacterium]|nr:MAG: ion transporter [Candidatus Peregrinibacteria bacterium]